MRLELCAVLQFTVRVNLPPILLLLAVAASIPLAGVSSDGGPTGQRQEMTPVPVSLFAIPAALEQMEGEQEALRVQLDQLTSLQPPLQIDAYGHHGGYLPVLDELPDHPRWTLEVAFPDWSQIRQIILVPAVDHRFDLNKSYGFPRRFRVLQVHADGRTTVAREWMDADCHAPGRVPMLVELPDPSSSTIRIEVFRGAEEKGQELFALDEVYGIALEEIQRAVNVKAFPEFESLPYWSKAFAIDQRTGLGLPVGRGVDTGTDRPRDDYSVVFEGDSNEPCVVELDFGKNVKVGWVMLFSAQPPEGILIPGYGFPGDIRLQLIREEDGRQRQTMETRIGPQEGNPGNNLVRRPGRENLARWVRLTMKDIPEHNGVRTFAMGEVRVHKSRTSYVPTGVRVEGFPEGAEADAGLLIDGLSRGRPVMLLWDWLRELDKRAEMTGELEALDVRYGELTTRWRRFWLCLGVGVGLALLVMAVSFAVYEVAQRFRAVRKLRLQITRDLHDEVGSSLGSIALTLEDVAGMVSEPEIREDIEEAVLAAREASAGMHEVVWMTAKGTVRLPELLEQLVERARRVLRGVNVSEELLERIPDVPVSLSFRRHLVMFFREAVYNCARHAHPAHVTLRFSIEKDSLGIGIADDGCGFDPKNARPGGVGLNSLKQRAREMGGEMALESTRGEGTVIHLKVPLKSVQQNPHPSYKTSN